MKIYYLLLLLCLFAVHPWASHSITPSIMHGDHIVIDTMCFDLFTGQISRNQCKKKNTKYVVMRVTKYPYYSSQNNTLTPGNSVSLSVLYNKEYYPCYANQTFYCVKANGYTKQGTNIRILDKHGERVNAFNANGHYVKFREIGTSVDCNDGSATPAPNSFFTCKKVPKSFYGFTMYKYTV